MYLKNNQCLPLPSNIAHVFVTDIFWDILGNTHTETTTLQPACSMAVHECDGS